MQFNAAEPKGTLFLLFCLNLGLFITSYSYYSLIYLVLAIIFILCINIKYHFEINENALSFTTSLFGFEILKRKANNENIKLIEFKRIGWHQKAVFISLNKGYRWKIYRFHPNNFDKYIENFAINNSIENKKHKNY